MTQSTADRFIEVMALLNALDTSNDEPMRHQIRSIQSIARAVLDDAIRVAWTMAYIGKDISVESKAIVKEALEAATPPS